MFLDDVYYFQIYSFKYFNINFRHNAEFFNLEHYNFDNLGLIVKEFMIKIYYKKLRIIIIRS